jgi:hypothetical protein
MHTLMEGGGTYSWLYDALRAITPPAAVTLADPMAAAYTTDADSMRAIVLLPNHTAYWGFNHLRSSTEFRRPPGLSLIPGAADRGRDASGLRTIGFRACRADNPGSGMYR